MLNEDDFPAIERVDVDPAILLTFEDEDDFIEVGVKLVAEAASYVALAASILGPEGKWQRSEAVLGGLMVRLHKLAKSLLDQVCDKRTETAHILSRLIFETVVDVRYLIKTFRSSLSTISWPARFATSAL